MKTFPYPIKFLLLMSLLLTVAKAITLPFLAIYLSKELGLRADKVGYILGVSLFLSIISSVYGGYLVDRIKKEWTLWGSIATASAVLLIFPTVQSAVAAVIFLSLVHAAFSIIDIVIKALFAEMLEPADRIKAFSLRYMFINIGFAVGPLLAAVVGQWNDRLPFWLAGGLSLVILLPFLRQHKNLFSRMLRIGPTIPIPAFWQTVRVLRHDKCLLLFIAGGLLSAAVYVQFSAYLSQYLITVLKPDLAYRVLGWVITINACVVIEFQHFIARWIKRETLLRWVIRGSLFFVIGLVGFMSSNTLLVWVIAMIIFSLGEIIVVPVEYLFIDLIAPEHLKGSYYGVQNLSNLARWGDQPGYLRLIA